MNAFNTLILVKNIPAQELEFLLKQIIVTYKPLNDTTSIIVKIKNTRVLLITFTEAITYEAFDIFIRELLIYNKNLISKEEVIAVFNNTIREFKSENITKNTSIDEVFASYKITTTTPLYELFVLNNANCQSKKWWQFWK